MTKEVFTILKTDTSQGDILDTSLIVTDCSASILCPFVWINTQTCGFAFYELAGDALYECFCNGGLLAPQSDLVSPPPAVSVSRFSLQLM